MEPDSSQRHFRRAAVEANIPCGSSLDTARALVEALRAGDEALCLPFVAYREG